MVDATPQYLDPTLGTVLPRPVGLTPGRYPLQADAARLAWWTLGVSSRAIRQPFGATVGEPLHYAYDTSNYNLLAIDCRGDPDHAEDRSVIQVSMNNPPQVGRVIVGWFGADWRHSTLSQSAWFNRNLVLKTGNSFLGTQERAGVVRPVLGMGSLSPNGTSLATLTGITLVAPGSATVAGLDSPLVNEVGTALAPQPLRVPCWVGRWGFPGTIGQVLAGGATNQNLGFFLKLKPVTAAFVEDAANLRLSFAGATAEVGAEVFGACAYTMMFITPPATYSDMDYTKPGPPYPCKAYSDGCWKSREQTASIQVFLAPLGDTWQALVAVHQVTQTRTAAGGRYILYSNFSPVTYTAKATLDQGALVDDVTATPVPLGTTTAIVRPLFSGDATLTVTIVVSATGVVTTCEARITRNVTVTNLGPGWHDKFVKV
jgi:hypothetical protein